jgi:hypothetical protein
MNRKATRFAALLGSLIAGCGGGNSGVADASGDADAADAGLGSSDADAGNDSDTGSDGADAAPKPAPVASPGSRLVVPGAATLIGSGPDSCTNQVPSTGDRWCGFGRPAGAMGAQELWVLNATKAAAGVAITCDGTDDNCLRLATSLFKDPSKGFADSRFTGDTLIYEDSAGASVFTSPFLGLIHAWRPGWTSGRTLTTSTGVYCTGQARSDSALCFDNPVGDVMTTPLTADLHAGQLVDQSGPTLPTIDTIIMAVSSDPLGAPPRFQFDLSPDGAYVVWSTRPTPTGVETLKAQKVGDGQPMVVAADVSQWAMSPDGLSWSWLAGYNYDITGAPSGTLQVAAFPDGSGPTTLAQQVGEYAVVGNKGLWFRANVAEQVGALDWMADRAAPAALTTVDTNVLAIFDQVPDPSGAGARFVYAKRFTTLSAVTNTAPDRSPSFDLVDLYLGSATGAAPCVLAETPTAFGGALLPSGSAVIWQRHNEDTGETEGVATTAASCASTVFATSLRKVSLVADQGIIYLDDPDPAADEATLRYARIMDGALVTGTQLQTRAESVFAPLLPAISAVLYTVVTGTEADGLYVNATLPFTTTAAAP